MAYNDNNPGHVKWSSWGRTRTPKNILSKFRAGIDAAGTPKSVFHEVPVDVETENQRFLIVYLDSFAKTDNSDPTGLTVHGLCYAAATYAGDPLVPIFKPIALDKDIHGNAVVLDEAGKFAVIPIVGIDKVRFTCTGGDHANDQAKIYAACTTF